MAELGKSGMYNCSGPCGRARLIAAEFSKKQLEKWRTGTSSTEIYCKKCTEAKTMAEREKAAESSSSKESKPPPYEIPDELKCHRCERVFPSSTYSKTQLRKVREGTQRCLECVNASVKEDQDKVQEARDQKMAELQKKAKEAEASGDPIKALKALNDVASAEAELVTGIKAAKQGRNRPVATQGGGGGRGGVWGKRRF
eukprot:Sspe_Gene.68764::Locus_40542_Transcript_1_1_Confidence_1.000_Length_708::g.68764::m.68764